MLTRPHAPTTAPRCIRKRLLKTPCRVRWHISARMAKQTVEILRSLIINHSYQARRKERGQATASKSKISLSSTRTAARRSSESHSSTISNYQDLFYKSRAGTWLAGSRPRLTSLSQARTPAMSTNTGRSVFQRFHLAVKRVCTLRFQTQTVCKTPRILKVLK